MSVLNSMLNTLRYSEDKTKLTFWASHAFCMNDDTEMSYGREAVMKYLAYYEEERSILHALRLSTYLDDARKSKSYLGADEDVLKGFLYDWRKMPFVISFSRISDFIPMWGMYADKGYGVCLGFDEKEIDPREDNITFMQNDVLHHNTLEQNNSTASLLIKMIEQRSNKSREELHSIHNMDKVFEYKVFALTSLSVIASAFIKHESYKYEQEYRIMGILSNANNLLQPVRYRTNANETMIPYVEVGIPISSLKSIMLGPCANTLSAAGLKMQLASCGIPEDTIKVFKSKVPFRNV